MSKAFDMVSHNKLLKDLNNSSLPPHIKRWLSCYLHGRQSRVSFRNKVSRSRNVRTGVPQGAVSSPILFNFYLANLPPAPPGIKVIQYADDISIYTSGTSINNMCTNINNYINSVTDYLEERELLVSAEKSTVTLFTPDTHEYNLHPQIKIKGELIRLDKTPKVLGVTFDTMHYFNHHVSNTVEKAKKKLNVIKALAGTSWGQDQETLVITYKSICRSVLEYASPIWSPAISPTSWNKLQSVQNSALRVATGCYLKTNPAHLHQETKVLPLQDHCKLIAQQYLAACFLPGHPGRKHLDRPPDPRPTRGVNLLAYKPEVQPYFNNIEPDDLPTKKP